MTGISHVDAVDVLKSITDKCHLVISREVLIVLPEEITSPSPSGATEDKKVASPTPEGQPDKVKTPSPVQSKIVVSSPPPEGQVSKTSPPPTEDQVNKVSPPPQGQMDVDTTTTTNTVTVSSVVQSVSMEELRTFGEQMTQTASAALDKELVLVEVVEELLESAPQLESQLDDDSVEDKQPVIVKDDQAGVEVDDVSVLEEFAEQLRRAKEQELEEEMISMHINDVASLPRDNYVNYDIAQAIITSHSNESLADGEEDNGGGVTGDPHVSKNEGQSDNAETVKSKPSATEPAAAEPVATESAATEPAVVKSEVDVEIKKNEPKFVPSVTEEVVLSQGAGPLGMNIVGGIDRNSFPFGRGLPGVFISKVCFLFALIRHYNIAT